MIDASKFLHTKNGKLIMSMILGFGFATLFRQICKGKNCYIFHAPPLEDIEDNIFSYNGECYSYDIVQTQCDKNKKIIPFS